MLQIPKFSEFDELSTYLINVFSKQIKNQLPNMTDIHGRVYRSVVSTRWGKLIDEASGVRKVNQFNLVAVLLDIYRSLPADQSFTSDGVVSNLSFQSDDIIEVLLYKGAQTQLNIRDYDSVISLISKYETPAGVSMLAINIKDTRYPISFIQYENSVVFYRLSSSWEYNLIINSYLKAALPTLIANEVYSLGSRSSIKFKTFVLEKYCLFPIKKYQTESRFFDYIITDAYTDLMNISIMCQDKDISSRISMMEGIRPQFLQNMKESFTIGYYRQFHPQEEIDVYERLFNRFVIATAKLINYLNHGYKQGLDPPYDIKKYYIFDQLDSEKNIEKVDFDYIKREVIKFYAHNPKISSCINAIHPDIIFGLFNLSLHVKFLSFGQLYRHDSQLKLFIQNILNDNLLKKPILIKFILKNSADDYYHYLKEAGFIRFNQLEALFGYRNSHLIIDEIKEDFAEWVSGDQDKYSSVQSAFIQKWARPFFDNYINYNGKYLKDIIRNNQTKFNSFQQILGHTIKYLTSSGAVDNEMFRADTTDGKKRTVSKNTYFNLFKDPEQFINERKINRRNKVIIKREEYIKQRIVINSTMNTFVPLSKLNKFVTEMTASSGVMYFSQSKTQKAQTYARFQKYLLYNKHVAPTYLCLPLDYSSYDHTITMGFIDTALVELARYVGYEQDVVQLLDEFHDYLYKEKIYFDKLGQDPINNSPYKYGMLSGWKITSSVESLGNAIISYGVANELGLDLVDLVTMGDDLVMVLRAEAMTIALQQSLLKAICDVYNKLGFKMNVPKNSVGYYFLEFLRVTQFPGLIQCYPTRALPPLVLVKPGRERDTFGIVEFQSTLKKVSKRYGARSKYLVLGDYLLNHYIKRDLRLLGPKYLRNPANFNITRRDRIDYMLQVDVVKSPIFARYSKLLGPFFKTDIIKYLQDNVVSQKVTISNIVELPKSQRLNNNSKEISYIKELVSKFKRTRVYKDFRDYKIRIPEYHLSKLVQYIIIKNKVGFTKSRLLIINLINNLRIMGMINDWEATDSLEAVAKCRVRADLIAALEADKILVDDEYTPITIVSQIKVLFIKYIKVLLSYERNYMKRAFYSSLIHKNRNPYVRYVLGLLLSDITEIKLANYSCLVANCAD